MADFIELGNVPTNILWDVVRGDTATLLVNFFENDEVTPIDTNTWTFAASAYDPKTMVTYSLDTEPGPGFVNIIAQPTVTTAWGDSMAATVAELRFDLEITRGDGVVWTPIIGTVKVAGDITNVL